jgi:hypothetical protein
MGNERQTSVDAQKRDRQAAQFRGPPDAELAEVLRILRELTE